MTEIKFDEDIYWWDNDHWDGPFESMRDDLNKLCIADDGPQFPSRGNASAFLAEKILSASIITLETTDPIEEGVDY